MKNYGKSMPEQFEEYSKGLDEIAEMVFEAFAPKRTNYYKAGMAVLEKLLDSEKYTAGLSGAGEYGAHVNAVSDAKLVFRKAQDRIEELEKLNAELRKCILRKSLDRPDKYAKVIFANRNETMMEGTR